MHSTTTIYFPPVLFLSSPHHYFTSEFQLFLDESNNHLTKALRLSGSINVSLPKSTSSSVNFFPAFTDQNQQPVRDSSLAAGIWLRLANDEVRGQWRLMSLCHQVWASNPKLDRPHKFVSRCAESRKDGKELKAERIHSRMAVDMAIDSQQQPGAVPALLAAPAPAASGSRAAGIRVTRAEAADYVAKYDQMRKLCAQRLREKFFSDQTPDGQDYYESEVQVGDFVVKESTEDPLDRFTTGLGPVEELQEPAYGSRSAPYAEVPSSMNRLKSQARKK